MAMKKDSMSQKKLRKLLFVQETVFAEGEHGSPAAVHRVAAIAVVTNPLVANPALDLDILARLSEQLGKQIMPQAVALLPHPALAYGKGAIIGVNGELEHAAAMLHPRLGRPIRAAIGGGAAIISSTAKVASAGSAIDIPLAHKDDIWSFDHLDTMTVMVADAPRPDEIVLVIAIAAGGRIGARVAKPAV